MPEQYNLTFFLLLASLILLESEYMLYVSLCIVLIIIQYYH
jgi:hypothetical protein